jgi:hypothetical protein
MSRLLVMVLMARRRARLIDLRLALRERTLREALRIRERQRHG